MLDENNKNAVMYGDHEITMTKGTMDRNFTFMARREREHKETQMSGKTVVCKKKNAATTCSIWFMDFASCSSDPTYFMNQIPVLCGCFLEKNPAKQWRFMKFIPLLSFMGLSINAVPLQLVASPTINDDWGGWLGVPPFMDKPW